MFPLIATLAVMLTACSASESPGDNPDVVDVNAPSEEIHDETTDGGRDGIVEPAQCVPSVAMPNATHPVAFRRVESALSSHLYTADTGGVRLEERLVYGAGGVVTDIDGDGYLDALLSGGLTEPPEVYVYLNAANGAPQDSAPFHRSTVTLPVPAAAGGRRFSADGPIHFYGRGGVNILSATTPPVVVSDLNDDAGCEPFSILQNGRVTAGLRLFYGSPKPDGDDASCAPSRWDGGDSDTANDDTSSNMYVLATARLDANNDGIVDTAIAVDSFSGPPVRNTSVHPGGILIGGLPDSTSVGVSLPWLRGTRAWGSHMGINAVNVADDMYTILGDWGPPLIRDSIGAPATFTLAADGDGDREGYPYSWSPIVVDFNGDQRDDVLLTRGTVNVEYADLREDDRTSTDNEADVLFVQTEDGEFVDMTEGSGLLAHPPAYPVDHELEAHHVSRAGLATDFDRDGRVDVLIVPYEGRPLHYEAEAQTHCLARVTPAYSQPHDVLHGWSWLDHDLGEHPVRVDGHMLLGEPEYMLVPAIQGAMRAPSGARVPYDCEPGDLVDVVEPVWATVDGSTATLELCAAGLDPSLIQSRTVDGELQVEFVNDTGSAEIDLSGGAVDLFIDGRYAVTCYPDGDCLR